jgi:hypothetical protein
VGLKNFNGYIFENDINVKELPLFFSPKLTKILISIDSKIATDLLDLSKSGQKFQTSYVDLTKDIDSIGVLPANRVGRIPGITENDLVDPSPDSPVWGEKGRQPMRIGAFVARLLPKYAGTKDLENFVHLIKAKLDAGNYKLEIVRGEEIRKWYHVKTYYNPHPGMEEAPEEGVLDVRTPLMKSCLKQPEKQSFFDIYCVNPEQVGMLIMLNGDNKLVARAIIWFDCYVVDVPGNPTRGILMDRIYYTNESDVNIFIDYAKERGWWYKPNQAKEVYTFVKNGEVCNKGISTRLKNHGVFPRYPYIDTMCFYTPDTGRLSTTRGKPAKNPVNGTTMERYQLHRANGGTKRLARDK